MTASPVSRVALAALLVAFAPGVAAAQDAAPAHKPRSLYAGATEAQKTGAAPAPQVTEDNDVAVEMERQPRFEIAPPVQIGTLQAVDGDSVGLLDQAHGGFSIDVWKDSDRATVLAALNALPASPAFPAQRALQRRLLLTLAKAPKPADSSQDSKKSGADLLGARAERLMAMGEVNAVAELLRNSPSNLDSGLTNRLRVDGLLLAGDTASACNQVRGAVAESQDTYFQKALVFCQLQAGETGKAQFTADLLRESGQVEPVFFTLVEAMGGNKKVKLDSLPDPSPLHLAMLSAAKRSLPKDAALAPRPALLMAVAANTSLSLDQRLDAAERAEMLGALPTDALRQLYQAAPFTPEELAGAVSRPPSDKDIKSRLILYRAAMAHSDPAVQADLLARALRIARAQGRLAAMARVSLPLLRKIPAMAEFAWFAADAGRALFAAKAGDEARAWLTVAKQGNPEVYATLWPLTRLAGGQAREPYDAARLSEWLSGIRNPDLAAGALALMAALGDPVGSAQWASVLADSGNAKLVAPKPALWFGLDSARAGKRLGETILFASAMIGEAPAGAQSPVALAAALSALRAVGLEKEARDIALEVALDAIP